eukprot:TRINITY_DN5069_c4_g1_i1.p1 TRINITY_DN5069_c4_g1~~TRINITY_DN5069_c4_g1_i1.p1  ORF type:complete len:392 (+),score=80.29 TRINITY_DN5069_c4_g1_i1:191-1366(+)
MESSASTEKQEASASTESTAGAAPAPAPQKLEPVSITLHLQKDFLDFSHLETQERKDYEESVMRDNYGIYSPARYAGVALPPQLPITHLTPLEQRAATEESRRKWIMEQEEKKRGETANAKPGFFGSIKGKLSAGAKSVQIFSQQIANSVSTETIKTSDRFMRERFRFLLLPQEEKLNYDFRCALPCGDTVAFGRVTVTTNFVVFTGSKRNSPPPELGAGVGRDPASVRVSLPLRSLRSFHFARSQYPGGKTLSTVTLPFGYGIPGVTRIPSPLFTLVGSDAYGSADSLLLYDDKGVVHVLFDFGDLGANLLLPFAATLDRAWRALAIHHSETAASASTASTAATTASTATASGETPSPAPAVSTPDNSSAVLQATSFTVDDEQELTGNKE